MVLIQLTIKIFYESGGGGGGAAANAAAACEYVLDRDLNMVKMTLGQRKTDKKLRGYLRNLYWKVLVIQQHKFR